MPPLPPLATTRAIPCPPRRTRARLARPEDGPRGSDRAEAQKGAQRVAGISAAELLERGGNRYGSFSAGELHRWLVEAGFAVDGGGLLRPTELGLECGRALAR